VVRADHLSCQARTLHAKVRAAEERVLTATYDQSTVPALRAVHSHLRDSLEALEARHADVARRLKRYDDAAATPVAAFSSSSASSPTVAAAAAVLSWAGRGDGGAGSVGARGRRGQDTEALSIQADGEGGGGGGGWGAVDFETLAREYAELDVELKHREWTLRQIRKDVVRF